MKNRSRLDIVTGILTAANDGASMSAIMYEIYLSSRPLKKYLNEMTGEGLIAYDSTTRVYRVTPKGLRVLHMGERLMSMLSLEYGLHGKPRPRQSSLEKWNKDSCLLHA